MATTFNSDRKADVAIIGSGFSGAMTAVNLARFSRQPLHLVLINQNSAAGRGIAYGTRQAEHLLNVVARNMSAFPDLPDHFVNWLQTRTEYELEDTIKLREKFIPRRTYGDYIKGLMQHYLVSASPISEVTTDFLCVEAIDIQSSDEGLEIKLASGDSVHTNHAVLATGNEPPAELEGVKAIRNHPAWIGNPWSPWHERLPPDGGTILLLGTGLTTVDAIVTLQVMGWKGTLKAISRHGWLPHSHFRGIEYPDFPPSDVELTALTLDELVKLMELHCEKLRRLEANPAIVVDKLRPYTQSIWKGLSLNEKRFFTKNIAARWNVQRHRIAPEIDRIVSDAHRSGFLQVQAGCLEHIEPIGNRLRVNWRHQDEDSMRFWDGDLVINATGPQTSFSKTRSTLLRNLLDRGAIDIDEMDMGLRIASDQTVIDRANDNSKRLFAIGPILRGTFWETIAVPELRGQAKRIAETILNLQADQKQYDSMVMMEYMI